MKKTIEIVESLADSSLLPEGVSETIQNEAKEQSGGFLNMLLGTLGASLLGNILAQKGGFLSMLLGTLGASLFGNLLTDKGIYRAEKGKGINRAGERVGYGRPLSSALQNNKMDF